MVAPGEQSEEARLFHDMARENTRDRSFYDPEFVFHMSSMASDPQRDNTGAFMLRA